MKGLIVLSIIFLSLNYSCSSKEYQSPSIKGGLDSLYNSTKGERILPSSCQNPGRVFLRVVVGTDGLVKEVTIKKGLCPEADTLAVRIARRVVFSPAIKNDHPIETIQFLALSFEN